MLDFDLFVSSVGIGFSVTCLFLLIIAWKYPIYRWFRRDPYLLYVAGAWKHREDMDRIMHDFVSLGYGITVWWASPDKNNELKTLRDYQLCSHRGIQGLMSADTVIVFLTDPGYEYKGTFTEIGCGIGMGKRIIVVCDGTCIRESDGVIKFSHVCMNNVFFWDPAIEHVTHYHDAVKLLRGEYVASPYEKDIRQ